MTFTNPFRRRRAQPAEDFAVALTPAAGDLVAFERCDVWTGEAYRVLGIVEAVVSYYDADELLVKYTDPRSGQWGYVHLSPNRVTVSATANEVAAYVAARGN